MNPLLASILVPESGNRTLSNRAQDAIRALFERHGMTRSRENQRGRIKRSVECINDLNEKSGVVAGILEANGVVQLPYRGG